MSYFKFSLCVAVVFLISFLGTALIKRLGLRGGWVATARKDRWHTRQVALHGGCGFFPAFLLGTIWLIAEIYGAKTSTAEFSKDASNGVLVLASVLFGGLVMFLVGLWDDLKPIRPAMKLFSQLMAVTPLISLGGLSSISGIQLLDILFTYFWFIWIINAVNLLDNMDGLASGIVILSSVTLIILNLQVEGWNLLNSTSALILFIFAAALLGFWIHNWPPASIFMGDAGSLSLGFVLSAFTLPHPLNEYTGLHFSPGIVSAVLPLLLPITILAVPIFDTTFVTITRSWRAQNIALGGKDHSSHRLVILGLSERETLFVFYGIAILGGFFAVLMQKFPTYSLILFGGFGIALILIGIYLAHVKVEIANKGETTVSWIPLKYRTTLYKRNAAEMLLDFILIIFCFYGSYMLRFEGNLAGSLYEAMLDALPWVAVSTLFSFVMVGVYRSQWKFISVADIPIFINGVVGGAVLSLAVVTLLSRFGEGHSRSAFVIFGFLLFTTVVGSRLSFRLLDFIFVMKKKRALEGRRPILIYSSGKEGKLLYEEMKLDPNMQRYEIVGFIDPEGEEAGNTLCGLPIKTESEWLQFSWESKPRIFIPLSLSVDEFADELAQRWGRKGIVYRFKVVAEPVRSASKMMSYQKDE